MALKPHERPFVPQRVTGRRLDKDHLGADIGEQPPGEGRRRGLADLDDAKVQETLPQAVSSGVIGFASFRNVADAGQSGSDVRDCQVWPYRR